MESLEATLPYLVRYSYLGVYGLILLFSTAVPFFSKTLVIVAAGILASQGIGSLPIYLVVSLAGLVTADSIFYSLGYFFGERVLGWKTFSGARNEQRFREAEARFRRHDGLAVFSARFLPFLRCPIFIGLPACARGDRVGVLLRGEPRAARKVREGGGIRPGPGRGSFPGLPVLLPEKAEGRLALGAETRHQVEEDAKAEEEPLHRNSLVVPVHEVDEMEALRQLDG